MSEKGISNEDMRDETLKFINLLKVQRKKWESEGKTGFAYSCDLISQSLTTLYIVLENMWMEYMFQQKKVK